MRNLGAHLTPEVTASNCRWCPLGNGKHLSLQGEVLEQSVSVDHVTVAMTRWLNSPGSVSLGRTAATLQECSPLHYLAVSGVFLFGMFDNFFLLVMLRVNFLLSSHQGITELVKKKNERNTIYFCCFLIFTMLCWFLLCNNVNEP